MFIITLKQASILIGYIMLGYALCRSKIISKESSKTLSKLLIYVFAPAYTVPSLINGLDAAYIGKYIVIVLFGCAVCIASILLAQVLSLLFEKSGFKRNLYKYMFAFSNIGYFGYPLVKGVFGDEALASFMLFALPINIGINSYGYYILTSDGGVSENEAPHNFKKEYLKRIFSVPFFTNIIGIILGLLPITFPEIFFDVLSPAGGCYSVSAMLIAGFTLSSYSFSELFLSRKPYFAGLIRLVLIPFVLGGAAFLLCKFINLNETVLMCTVAFTALPAGMNVVVFPEFAGKDGSLGAKSCFISYAMSLLTIPCWFYLLSVLLKA